MCEVSLEPNLSSCGVALQFRMDFNRDGSFDFWGGRGGHGGKIFLKCCSTSLKHDKKLCSISPIWRTAFQLEKYICLNYHWGKILSELTKSLNPHPALLKVQMVHPLNTQVGMYLTHTQYTTPMRQHIKHPTGHPIATRLQYARNNTCSTTGIHDHTCIKHIISDNTCTLKVIWNMRKYQSPHKEPNDSLTKHKYINL